MSIEIAIIDLLRISIPDRKLDRIYRNNYAPEQLSQIYTLAARQDIAHLAAHALEYMDLPETPVLKQFQAVKKQAIYRYMRLDHELNQICSTLEREKIPFIPLKGAVLRKYYPQPWMRTSCDIDILVHREDLDAAMDCLVKNLSYTTDGKVRYHDIYLYSPSGIHLELHFSIQENMENIDPVLSRVWNHVHPVTEFQYEMEDEFLVFHLLAHMSYHFAHGGCGIRPFLDMFLLKSKNVYNEEKLIGNYLAESGLERFYNCVMDLTGVWFRGEEYSETTKRMESFLLSGGIYGSEKYRIAIEQKRKGGKIGFILYRIFMPYRELKIKYPILEKYPVLIPFFHVKRWIGMFTEGRLKIVFDELKINGSTDKENAEMLNCFLNEVGL